jgi:hypothetical protein
MTSVRENSMHSDRKAGALLVMCALAAVAGAQININNTTPASIGFVDISMTGGTALTMFDDTTTTITTTVGNALIPAGPVRISTNGVVMPGDTSGFVDFGNEMLTFNPPPAEFGTPFAIGYACPWWDDLQPITGSESTTIYWQEIAGVLYIMWKDIGHFPNVAGQTITFQMQVFSNPSACGPSIQWIYVDTDFGGTQAGFDDADDATIGYVGNGPLNPWADQWSFNTPSVTNGTVLTVIDESPLLTASSPFGAGSLFLTLDNMVSCTPLASATYVLAATLNQGTFPNGPIAGVDIPMSELLTLITIGAPFVGTLSNGGTTVGVFEGLPPVTVYIVFLRFFGGACEGHSNAISYTIP